MCSCTSPHNFKDDPDALRIWNKINQSKDASITSEIRNSFNYNAEKSVRDPAIPIRQPEIAVPVYVPASTNPITNERKEGSWKYLIIQDAEWTN